VQEALTRCPRVLVVLSPSSVESPNVQDEVTFALEERKTVLPVLYRDCKVLLELRGFQYVDFRTDYARALQALLKTLSVLPQDVIALAPAVSFESKPAAIYAMQASEEQRTGKQKQAAQEVTSPGDRRIIPFCCGALIHFLRQNYMPEAFDGALLDFLVYSSTDFRMPMAEGVSFVPLPHSTESRG